MAAYDIFRQHLALTLPDHGHALWDPNPTRQDRPVQVGDVGFIRRGKFHRLFNALLPAGDPSHDLGVPEHHKPLVSNYSGPLDPGSLSRGHYCSGRINAEPESSIHAK